MDVVVTTLAERPELAEIADDFPGGWPVSTIGVTCGPHVTVRRRPPTVWVGRAVETEVSVVSVRPAKAGPVQAFAAELRALRRRCGTPDFPSISRRTGASVDALAEAVGGEHLPAWATVAAFVRGCGAQAADWRTRWEQARDGLSVCIPLPRQPS